MLIPADMVAQRRYVRSARQFHPDAGLAIGPTILRGLRDLGFRDAPAALAALVDNAIDAQADRIDIVLDMTRGGPSAIAVIDNGLGMVPEMMRAACALGATCQLGEGPHLARSGFGLPSAPFAIGRRFDLISCPRSAPLQQLTLDLTAVDDDAAVPDTHRAELPRFVAEHLATQARHWAGGTIVVISDLDRIAPAGSGAFREALRQRLGYVFQHFMPRVAFHLDGAAIPPIDPLFLTPECLGFNADDQRAIAFDPFEIAVGGAAVRVCSAALPPAFGSISKDRESAGSNANQRAPIMRAYNGLIVSRQHRRLALLEATPLFSFAVSDRAVKLEIEVPAAVDDLLLPSLSLSQVQITERLWAGLRAGGLGRHLDMLRRQCRRLREQQRATGAAAVVTSPAPPSRRNRCGKQG